MYHPEVTIEEVRNLNNLILKLLYLKRVDGDLSLSLANVENMTAFLSFIS